MSWSPRSFAELLGAISTCLRQSSSDYASLASMARTPATAVQALDFAAGQGLMREGCRFRWRTLRQACFPLIAGLINQFDYRGSPRAYQASDGRRLKSGLLPA
jgi:hypothetical protein